MGKHASRCSARVGVLLALPFAGWEVFLRFDSEILSPVSKLWFLPALAFAILLVAAGVARGIAAFPALRKIRWAFVLAAGLAALGCAGAFTGVARGHDPDAVGFWPIAALLGGAYGLACVAVARRLPVRSGAGGGSLAWGTVCVAAFAATIWSTAELSNVMLRGNSPIGRLFAMAYGRFPISLDGADAQQWKPPALSARDSLPGRHVVIISIDTLRADFLSPYGERTIETPAIERFSEESVLFEDAYAQRPTSGPSMASVFTGLFPENHGVRMNGWRMNAHVETLAESFAAAGYRTAGFHTNAAFLEAFDFQQGFDVYEFHAPEPDAAGLMTGTVDAVVVDRALAWAAEEDPDRALLWVHLIAPHAPYLSESPPAVSAGRTDADWFNVWNMRHHEARLRGRQTSFDKRRYLAAYEEEVRGADFQVGRLLEGLGALGWIEDSHVIVLSDHGETFGEADAFGHGHTLHRAETRIPVLWRLPRAEAGGTRVAMTIQGADLAPTLLRLQGLEVPEVDGRDISGVLRGERKQDVGFAFSDAGWRNYLHTDGFKYAVRTRERALWIDTGFPHVLDFDRRRDPLEENFSRRQDTQEPDPIFDALLALADRGERQRKAARGSANQDLDAQALAQLRALGYLE